jgi:cytochrome c553
LLLAILVSSVAVHVATAAEKVSPFVVSPKAAELLESYCFSCHDEETQKGDIRLDRLDTLALDTRLDLLNKVQEQVFFKEMPPKKKSQRKRSGTPFSSGSRAS